MTSRDLCKVRFGSAQGLEVGRGRSEGYKPIVGRCGGLLCDAGRGAPCFWVDSCLVDDTGQQTLILERELRMRNCDVFSLCFCFQNAISRLLEESGLVDVRGYCSDANGPRREHGIP